MTNKLLENLKAPWKSDLPIWSVLLIFGAIIVGSVFTAVQSVTNSYGVSPAWDSNNSPLVPDKQETWAEVLKEARDYSGKPTAIKAEASLVVVSGIGLLIAAGFLLFYPADGGMVYRTVFALGFIASAFFLERHHTRRQLYKCPIEHYDQNNKNSKNWHDASKEPEVWRQYMKIWTDLDEQQTESLKGVIGSPPSSSDSAIYTLHHPLSHHLYIRPNIEYTRFAIANWTHFIGAVLACLLMCVQSIFCNKSDQRYVKKVLMRGSTTGGWLITFGVIYLPIQKMSLVHYYTSSTYNTMNSMYYGTMGLASCLLAITVIRLMSIEGSSFPDSLKGAVSKTPLLLIVDPGSILLRK
jgi:hypothetical protein